MHNAELGLILSVTAIMQAAPLQQPASSPENYVVRADVNMIVVHATVQDRRGAFVTGLSRDAFTITEDGVKQQVAVFSSDDVPVAVGLVIDNSGSMGRRWADVITGALTFIRDSKPEDEIFVVHFSQVARLGLPPDRPFSANVSELRTALMTGHVSGHTALYDGIALALDHFNKASLMKKVLLIVSDGGDNRSRNRLNDVVKRADRAGVLMYTIGLFDENSEDRNPGVLKQLAGQTGGLAYLPQDLKRVPEICSQIARDIRNQYTIGYNSTKASADSGYHQIKVTAVDARNRQLRVRSRTGFFGVTSTSTRETELQPRPSPQ
jgi:Ca-activated chloride channel homolog